MSSISSAPAGAQFTSSPVVVTVTATERDFTPGSTSRKMELRVLPYRTAYLARDIMDDTRYIPVSWPYDDTTAPTPVDISSALRALLGIPEYDPNKELASGFTYPAPLEYALALGHSELVDCQLVSSFDTTTHGIDNLPGDDARRGGSYALRGALTDMERRDMAGHGVTDNATLTLTRKPATPRDPELCGPEHTHTTLTLPKNGLTQDAPTRITTTAADTEGTRRVVSPAPHCRCHELAFVNTLGALETVTARCFESMTRVTASQTYKRDSLPAAVPALSGTAFASPQETPYTTLAMSSGPVSRAWARWWAEEFLASPFFWMRITRHRKTLWTPVIIEPEKKEIPVYDSAKPATRSVGFSLRYTLSDTEQGLFDSADTGTPTPPGGDTPQGGDTHGTDTQPCLYCYANGAEVVDMDTATASATLAAEAAALDSAATREIPGGQLVGNTITFAYTQPYLWLLQPVATTPFNSASDVATGFTFPFEDGVTCDMGGERYLCRRSNGLATGETVTLVFR